MTLLTKIQLENTKFKDKETVFAEHGELSASLFRFNSGVCALRMKNSVGDLVLLPFQGQQIWDATMRGRRLTMKSMFDQPFPTHDFLSTFGGFLVHCGATVMGVPGRDDKHPLHGELPNALYQSATVIFGSDEKGDYICLTGTYRHTVAFDYNYTATPLVKLYASSSVFTVSMIIQNLKASPMPLMFLEHINFRPYNDGRLVQTVSSDPENMRLRVKLPNSLGETPGYRESVIMIKEHPEKHLVFDQTLVYDPEILLYLNYVADKAGWAHSMQVHPDGSADLVRHRPDQLNHCNRWICRTPDQDALGFEPATAGVEGFTAEKKKGNVRSLMGGGTFVTDLEVGVLVASEAQREEMLISQIMAEAK